MKRSAKIIAAVLASAVEVYGVGPLKKLIKSRIPRLRSSPLLGFKSLTARMNLPLGHVRSTVRRIPENQKSRMGTIIVQKHDSRTSHFDLSIIDEGQRELFRGSRTAKELAEMFPADSRQRRMWVQQPEHSASYSLDNQKLTIPVGQYGAGIVTRVMHEPCEILKSSRGRIDFMLGGDFKGNYVMLNRGDDSWLVVKKSQRREIIPKHEYKSKDKELLDAKRMLFEHKVDGHHTHVELGEKNRFWSWRRSKRTGTSINYDDKLPKWRDEAHPELEGTKIRGELVFVEHGLEKGKAKLVFRNQIYVRPSLEFQKLLEYHPIGAEMPSFLAGRLNNGTWLSREKFDKADGEAAIVIFDCEKIKGRSISHLTYGEKHAIMEGLAKNVSFIYLPRSWADGREAWRVIVEEEGREGLVVKNPAAKCPYPRSGNEVWKKVKTREFLDCRVVGATLLTRKGTQLDDSRIGALIVTNPSGRGTFQVGGGFTDQERLWLAKNLNRVIEDESWIRVRHDPKLEDRRAPHAPQFHSVHPGKTSGALIEMSMLQYTDGDSIYPLKVVAGWRRK